MLALSLILAACGSTQDPKEPAASASDSRESSPVSGETEKSGGKKSGPGEGTKSDSKSPEETSETETVIPDTEADLTLTSEQADARFTLDGLLLDSKALCVTDVEGNVLLQKNAFRELRPASITKVMTALVAVEHAPDLDARVTVSENAVREGIGIMSSGVNPSLKPGEVLTVRELLYALILPSTNAAANVLAEYTAGSIAAFVELMNEKAAALGCKNTHYVNPHGLDADRHFTCPYDMCRILRAACGIPELREILGTGVYTIPATNYSPERRFYATHQMICQSIMVNGVFAGKPGSTYGARSTLVTAASRGGQEIYICTMDSDEGFLYQDHINLIQHTYDLLNSQESQLAPMVCDAKITGEDEKGVYLRWRTGNGAKNARLVYYRLIKGTEDAVFRDLGKAEENMSYFIPLPDQGIYVLQLFASDESGREEGLGAKFLYSGNLKPEGVFEFDGTRYLLDHRGFLRCGACPAADGVYYTNDRGALGYGFVGGRFYAGQDGKLISGWVDYDGCRYYLQADGRIATGDILIDGKHYRFSEHGILLEEVLDNPPAPGTETPAPDAGGTP